MHPALSQFRHLVVVNADRRLLELSLQFRTLSKGEQRKCFGGDATCGFFYVYALPAKPDLVMETVVSVNGDSVTSLYKPDPVFADFGDLIRCRQALIGAVAEKVGLSPDAVGVDDEARGRSLGLVELSTGQLLDMLAEQTGETLIKADNHGVTDLNTGGAPLILH